MDINDKGKFLASEKDPICKAAQGLVPEHTGKYVRMRARRANTADGSLSLVQVLTVRFYMHYNLSYLLYGLLYPLFYPMGYIVGIICIHIRTNMDM